MNNVIICSTSCCSKWLFSVDYHWRNCHFLAWPFTLIIWKRFPFVFQSKSYFQGFWMTRGWAIFCGSLQVIAARHLPNSDHIVSPFVQIELYPYTGQAEDYIFKTTLISEEMERELLREKFILDFSIVECWYCSFTEANGLNPVWLGLMTKCFEVDEPDLAFLRFVVFEEDIFSDCNTLAQATIPVRGIRSGKSIHWIWATNMTCKYLILLVNRLYIIYYFNFYMVLTLLVPVWGMLN